MTGAGDMGCALVARRVAESYHLSVDALLSRGRTRTVVEARGVALAISRSVLKRSYPELGMAFCKDHTTCMVAVKKVHRKVEADQDFAVRVFRILQKCAEELAA